MTGRRVVLLVGPPGAGKTTQARASGLTVFDRDDPRWQSEADFAAALVKLGRARDAAAVVIRSGATSSARAKTARIVRATHVYVLLAEPDDLKDRIRGRRRDDLAQSIRGVDTWFARFDRRDGVREFPGWSESFEPAWSVSEDW